MKFELEENLKTKLPASYLYLFTFILYLYSLQGKLQTSPKNLSKN